MGFDASSDPFIAIAWTVGLVAVVLTIGLALQVLAMRERSVRRRRRREKVFATWRPIMFEYLLGGVPALPALSPRDEDSFLLLWNQLQDGLRGETRAELNRLADAVDAHGMAQRRLRRRDALGRLLALRTLGFLGRASDLSHVAQYLDDARAYLALAAARALVHIDPRRSPDAIVPRLAVRVDWPVPLFASVLSEADPACLTALFRELYARLTPSQAVRLLPLVSILQQDASDAILDALLESASDPEVLCAALKRIRGPGLLRHVRRACRHESWAVRTQAVAALGKVGERSDRDLLLRSLSDPQWWVRYRAAQGLTSSRFGSAADIAEVASRLEDRFARDIVEHALAEKRE